MGPVTVFTAISMTSADMACSRLNAAGFDAVTMHDISALSSEGFTLGAGGVSVQVPGEQAADALAFLKSDEEQPPQGG